MRVIILYVIILAPIHCWSQTTQSDSLKNKEVPQAVKNLLNQYKEQTEKAKKERLPRITSYNVCYTKLLRGRPDCS